MKKYQKINKLLILVIALLVLTIPAYAQVTVFNESLDEISLSFPEEYTSKYYYIQVPNGTVAKAMMRIEGFDLEGQSILPADVILITDVSGSMNDDCGPDRIEQPGETPCKINDAMTADLSFLDNVNLNYIHVGLVHYSYWGTETLSDLNTDLDIHLTNDRAALESEIGDYEASGWTNMGGGMEIAMEELLDTSYAQDTNRKYMLVMTDGMANCYAYDFSQGISGGGECDGSTYHYQQGAEYVRYVANQAEANGITIYGIAFGSGADTGLVQEITTNGQLYYAPDASTLLDIYNEIAQSISVQNFTTPVISSRDPVSEDGWGYPSPYSMDVYWDDADCGTGAASCMDYRQFIQDNLDQCLSDPCDIQFSVFSPTVGMLNLSELFIEINEPPEGNYEPPIGTCRYETITCGEREVIVDIDDGSMVTDPNDPLDTLTWGFSYSVESTGGAYFDMNNDFNTIREINVSVDPNYLYQSFSETFYFEIGDPWGETTEACLNVTYQGCADVTPILDISDRTISFDYSAYPGYRYNLSDMIDTMENLVCTVDELGFIISDPNNFFIYGPDADSTITIVPANPDWLNPTTDNIIVEVYCVDEGAGEIEEITIYGNADVILVTDFSGSMKKAVDSWSQGIGVSDCEELYTHSDARKTHLARCLDIDLTQTVMSYEENRIWPVFLHNNEIESYPGDPYSTADVVDYIDKYGPQGDDQTCLSCAINEGYDILEANSGDDRTKFIVLMTDGVPTHCSLGSCTSTSTIYGNQMCNGFCDTNGMNGCGADVVEGCSDDFCSLPEDNTLFSMGRAYNDMNVMFYTISFGLVEDCIRSQMLLGQIASTTGGEYHHSKDVNELRQIYEDIAYQILTISKVSEEYYITTDVRDTATLTIIYDAVSGVECRDGNLDPGEECDDGNNNNYDTCTNICTLTTCGDGLVQQPNGDGSDGPLDDGVEECDDGNSFNGDGCSNQCTSEFCGDSVIQPGLGEQCDDGDNTGGDGCSAFCQLEGAPECGNTILELGEQCDDGNNNNGDGCDQYCQLEPGITPGCGNAIIESGEQCDDGNNNNGDGCDQYCQLENPPGGCGNAILEQGETCDDGNNNNGDGCDEFCQIEGNPGCGNAILEQGETCDDGNFINGDGCDEFCQIENPPGPGCGNAILEQGETCDDGNNNNGDGCDEFCQIEGNPGCGNGVIEQGEICDDGCLQGIPFVCEDADDNDGCDQYCDLEVGPGCGNGVEEQGETCDDGNNNNGDGCDEFCQLEPNPVLSIFDTSISFDYSAYPGYRYNLSDMLSFYAILPCDADALVFQIAGLTNFAITGPDPADPFGSIVIIPILPTGWLDPTSDTVQVNVSCNDGSVLHSDSAALTITYTAEGAPEGEINCESTTPKYLLHDGETMNIDISGIFEFAGSPGNVNSINAPSTFAFNIVTDPANNRIRVTPSDVGIMQTIDVSVSTDIGIVSEDCPIILMNINSRCDDANCDGCGSDYNCYATNNCLDGQILIPNPFAQLVPGSLLPGFAQSEYFTIPSFTSPPATDGNSFLISPSSGDKYQSFIIDGVNVGHANVSAAIIEYDFADFQSNRNARICPGLRRIDYDIGETTVDPESDLLITSSKSIIGFYEIGGFLFSKGPYIFTAKVWLR